MMSGESPADFLTAGFADPLVRARNMAERAAKAQAQAKEICQQSGDTPLKRKMLADMAELLMAEALRLQDNLAAMVCDANDGGDISLARQLRKIAGR